MERWQNYEARCSYKGRNRETGRVDMVYTPKHEATKPSEGTSVSFHATLAAFVNINMSSRSIS